MADTVLYEVSDGLATITLNRPEAMNALNVAAKVALRDAVRAAADDDAVRAVLLTASGDRAFCVGQDLKEHIGLLAADRENGSGQTMSTVREHYNPIVRAISRRAEAGGGRRERRGGGCRVRFRAGRGLPDRRGHGGVQHVVRGVALTADSGISWTLPRVIGPGRAMDLLLFPRNISAEEAYELGVVNRVVPGSELRAEAEKVARGLAQGPTVAYAALKESVAYGMSHSLEEALEKEDELQTRAGSSEDHAIAVRAFVNKEKPKYLGR